MKIRLVAIVGLLAALLTTGSVAQNSIIPEEARYLAQPPPGLRPEIFASSFFPSWIHTTPVFSRDYSEIFWDMEDRLYSFKYEDGVWSASEEIIFSDQEFLAGEPFISPDGNRLFFLSRSPDIQGLAHEKENVWYIDRDGDSWTEPVQAGMKVNSLDTHWQLSVASNGNLYYMVRLNGDDDIFMSAYVAGEYQEPVRLNSGINEPGMYEMTPYIAPDESYLLFARSPDNTQNQYQLYLSKNGNGSWTEGERLTLFDDPDRSAISPIVSHDGKYLFFMSWTRSGDHRAHWMEAEQVLTSKLD